MLLTLKSLLDFNLSYVCLITTSHTSLTVPMFFFSSVLLIIFHPFRVFYHHPSLSRIIYNLKCYIMIKPSVVSQNPIFFLSQAPIGLCPSLLALNIFCLMYSHVTFFTLCLAPDHIQTQIFIFFISLRIR